MKSRFWKRNGPMILSGIASIGVAATAYATGKASIKVYQIMEAYEPEDAKQKIKIAFPHYILPAILGATTIVCIFSSTIMTRHQVKALTGAYAMLDQTLKQYREKVREHYGADVDRSIMDELMVEKAEHTTISVTGLIDNYDLNIPVDSETLLFYDEISKRYFETSYKQVLQALYHFNRNFSGRGYAVVNELYDFLGIDEISEGNELGWTILDGWEIQWVDFGLHETVLDDGLTCYILSPAFYPDTEWQDEWGN